MEQHSRLARYALGCAGIVAVGIPDYVATQFRVALHGHAHEEDRKRIELAKGHIKTGWGYLTNNKSLVDEETRKMVDLKRGEVMGATA